MINNKFSFSILFLIFAIFACKETKDLNFVRDQRFFEPKLRINDTIDGEILYSLHERYFVFGYNKNKAKFDSILIKMICKKLNEKELLSRIDITFQDYGKYSTYEEGEILSADFTKPIVSVVWDIEEPYKLKTKWGEKYDQKFIHFECEFKPEYKNIISKKD